MSRKNPKTHNRTKNRGGFPLFFAICISVLFLTTCGLEYTPYLEEVQAVSDEFSRVNERCVFENNPDNIPENFLGYEIYYRFYDPTTIDNPDTDPSLIPTGSENRTVEQLTSSQFKYRRLARATAPGQPIDDTRPAIQILPAERNTSFNITVNLDPETGAFTASYLSNSISLVRHIQTTDTEEIVQEGFLPEDLSYEDEDIENILPESYDDIIIGISFFVAVYGRFELSTEIYSLAKYIGYTELPYSPY
ncbi:MAG: hypothetical protein ACLFR1_00915 [Spirochaetia bacterium]